MVCIDLVQRCQFYVSDQLRFLMARLTRKWLKFLFAGSLKTSRLLMLYVLSCMRNHLCNNNNNNNNNTEGKKKNNNNNAVYGAVIMVLL